MIHRITPDLHIETLDQKHVRTLWLAVDDSRSSLCTWLPWVDSTLSRDDTEVFVTAARTERRLGTAWHFAIIESQTLIGTCSFNRIVKEHRWASLGYWLHQQHVGKGVMTRCVAALVDIGFSELSLHRLEIRCAVGNRRSRAVAERLGFEFEGCLRECEWVNGQPLDHRVYSRLRQ
ncbi:GNAT family N-acetyltransferase [Halomonas huangheensis]|uniref:N-acetyltransferase domain-containing protein n=1 Tax=Halomonas huangheensis TaxID=1178482 RepID=W1N515_9GAMM|nr:GNAT family protein [Halomonas huangheensis]ALM52100.1 hypothetical protein AR456_07245 [Halomonas huangheensis]ERL50662.1 hypothetical protein BJB45_05890 [Halomonas huangheensis]